MEGLCNPSDHSKVQGLIQNHRCRTMRLKQHAEAPFMRDRLVNPMPLGCISLIGKYLCGDPNRRYNDHMVIISGDHHEKHHRRRSKGQILHLSR